MLNLLIAILGDTYAKVQERKTTQDQKALAELILESEILLFWRKNYKTMTYMEICALDETRLTEKSTEEKFRGLKSRIASMEKTMRTRIAPVLKSLNKEATNSKRRLNQIVAARPITSRRTTLPTLISCNSNPL